MKSISQFATAALVGTFCFASSAFAGPGEDMARAHFASIGSGKVDALNAAYTDTSVLEWVGGPLDGVYTGQAKIGEVWKKFTGAQGALKVDVTNIQENANPAGVTVTADVRFSGKNTIPVRYVLTYRGDKLSSEVWQIDPKLGK
ncbi:nuclear transport factor 2 family protein [Roseibium aggregatum]|uniref:Nuclear transport factor 2 family protein n=1 Tax=Roseibium aggregatum TaxID=187304 RepID=A0A939J1F1_9HYPH|nr:nuclear transport factor 2 family protein [Roseibium aggregatum]MBN9672071.1 nuclear transport factor 2 family protein [Roseibium aggregatum]